MRTSETLKRARALIAAPRTWATGVRHGVKAQADGTYLHAYCAMGALDAVVGHWHFVGDRPTPTITALYEAIPEAERSRCVDLMTRCHLTKVYRGQTGMVSLFNDSVAEGQPDVVALFDRAIARAEALETALDNTTLVPVTERPDVLAEAALCTP